ncbi:uncharacterized protein G2W53_032816 [Senna tora]|uniref:Uncharacterized protein n=1 Tax=Senna tora TaxID=362788 RepID=A0A834SX45_9FABA|nr:uncharacterized protein G2W53_032816 [Senna tora]
MNEKDFGTGISRTKRRMRSRGPAAILLPPSTPLRLISRVPFSWEHFPGIPKNSCNQNYCKNPSLKLLPLPPPTTNNHSSKSTQLHHLDHQTRIPKKNYSSNRLVRLVSKVREGMQVIRLGVPPDFSMSELKQSTGT